MSNIYKLSNRPSRKPAPGPDPLAIKLSIWRTKLWLSFRRMCGYNIKCAVRHSGGREKIGFISYKAAHNWARENGLFENDYVVCEYNEIDLRFPSSMPPKSQ